MSVSTVNEKGIQIKAVDFDGHPVTAVRWRDRWVWRAAETGTAIGYEQGRKLVSNIRGEWSSDFREGVDYDVLRGSELAEFATILDRTDSVQSKPVGRGGSRSLMILYPSGIDRALILSRTEKGRRLRDLLVDHVLPQLRETGTAVLPGAVSSLDPTVAEALACIPKMVMQMEAQFAAYRADLGALQERVDVLRAEVGAGVIGSDVAKDKIEDVIEKAIDPVVDNKREARSLRRSCNNHLRNAVGFNGRDSSWAMLPKGMLSIAERALPGAIRESVQKFLRRRPVRDNGPLFRGRREASKQTKATPRKPLLRRVK